MGNTASIIRDGDSPWLAGLNADPDLHLEVVAVQRLQCMLAINKTLNRVIDKLSQSEPWSIVKMPQNGQDANAWPNADCVESPGLALIRHECTFSFSEGHAFRFVFLDTGTFQA